MHWPLWMNENHPSELWFKNSPGCRCYFGGKHNFPVLTRMILCLRGSLTTMNHPSDLFVCARSGNWTFLFPRGISSHFTRMKNICSLPIANDEQRCLLFKKEIFENSLISGPSHIITPQAAVGIMNLPIAKLFARVLRFDRKWHKSSVFALIRA